jgi:hypothetical protein
MTKIFKEPLLVFLLLGGAMFALFQQVSNDSWSDDAEIVITQGHIQALTLGFEKVWRRSPSPKELEGLIQNTIREEVFYREALAMGLDRDDDIVRRRLRQKMEFISEDIASIEQPDQQELQTFLNVHQQDYLQAARFSFRHIYFNSSKRGAATQDDALALLKTLGDSNTDTSGLGDSLMLKPQYSNETKAEIERTLGTQFLQALQNTAAGSWQGPIKSGFGLHLVYIDKVVEAQVSTLAQVRDVVLRDWNSAKRKQLNELFYESLRKRYKVTVADFNEGKKLPAGDDNLSMVKPL